jgi:uncharacterized protein (DUF2345 family)
MPDTPIQAPEQVIIEKPKGKRIILFSNTVVTTGPDCTITAGKNCTITTGTDCTITAGKNCIIYVSDDSIVKLVEGETGRLIILANKDTGLLQKNN